MSTTTPVAEQVFRVQQVADHLDTSTDVIYALAASGQLRAVRVGRLLRVPQSSLIDFLAGTAKH